MKKVKLLSMVLVCFMAGKTMAQTTSSKKTDKKTDKSPQKRLENIWVSFDFRKGQTVYSFKGKEMKIVQWNRHGAIQERVVPVAKIIPAKGKKLGKIISGPMPNIGGYGALFYKNLQSDSAQFTTLSFLEKSLFDPKRPQRRKAAEKIKPEFKIGKNTIPAPLVLFRSQGHYRNTVNKLPEISTKITLGEYKKLVNKMLQVLHSWNTKTTTSPQRLMKSSNIFELLIASGYKPSLKSIHNLHKAEYNYGRDEDIKEKCRN